MSRDKQFTTYKITNAHVKFDDSQTAKKFGCTGSLSTESTIKNITKKCEAVVVDSVTQITAMKIKFQGHVDREVLRNVFGIEHEGLKEGIYSYGTNSLGHKACLTFDAYDLRKTDKLMLAFPNCSASSGLKFNVKNGEDTVAEIELEFNVNVDENNNFYYEAFESEMSGNSEELKEKWHNNFLSSDMKA